MTTSTAHTDNKDDQELAKALANFGADVKKPATDGLNFEETPAPSGAVTTSPFGDASAAPADEPAATTTTVPVTDEPAATLPVPSEPIHAAVSSGNPALDSIKKDALNELRPLVDKLTVSAEEKFDTYLLLLRSTDDTTLIGPAHDAAKAIPDEARRAQALLDVIKEIDYLTTQK